VTTDARIRAKITTFKQQTKSGISEISKQKCKKRRNLKMHSE